MTDSRRSFVFCNTTLYYHTLNLSSSASLGTGEPLSIVFGIDNSFARHCAMAMLSLIKHAPRQQRIHFHVISCDNLSGCLPQFAALVRGTEHQLQFHTLESELFKGLPASSAFPLSIYYRLVAPYLLAQAKRLLYLDADIICLQPLGEELTQALTGHGEAVAAAVADPDPNSRAHAKAIGLRGEVYFNSGMLLIDAERWQARRVSEQAMALLQADPQRYRYPDQDALNKVLEGHVRLMPEQFNTLWKLGHNAQAYTMLPAGDTVLLHYAGTEKPWQAWNEQAATQFYRNIHAASPWAATRFDLPTRSNQAKRLYKLLFRKNALLRGAYWYVRFALKRLGERK